MNRFVSRKQVVITLCLFAALTLPALTYLQAAQDGKQTQPQPPPAAAAPFVDAHWHHLHLNTTDPKAAIEFYTSKFASEKARFAGLVDAVWTQKSWMLFTKTAQPPNSELTSAIWHFGWGAEDMKATYEKQLASGTKFFTPLTDISDIGGNGATGTFFYAYVESPDKQLIELNTANHHNFGHLHLFSADPVGAGEWYKKYMNAKARSTRRELKIGPSVTLQADNVNIIIYPIEIPKKTYTAQWKGRTEFDSTKGHTTDHIGFSVDNLADALEKLRKDGVKVTDEIRAIGPVKFAFIEGPDKVRIELVEGHARKD